ncbi:15937_t:CDS:2 [Entrophospora sp. SA101]|nr:873_t:CDS:2 [Entrophospora sp. SA101]CAJ0636325.1 6270_t:CDS:2 [Entrophospora sp. SA101]CAJ0762327.1 15937_t:CDS:2 [Entrophospora sp. SA101]CAJ0823187.1 3470_t:CDS:2 [Entrophospora sp. SA101]CAJ0904065.1 1261_t:CDS:2 [Entrophospora sp. SA101]
MIPMASGYGYNGGIGRCFNFWQEFRKCYAMANRPEDCIMEKEDYFECLHHTKEIARAKKIKAQELKMIEKRREEDQIAKKKLDSKTDVNRLGIVEEKNQENKSS